MRTTIALLVCLLVAVHGYPGNRKEQRWQDYGDVEPQNAIYPEFRRDNEPVGQYQKVPDVDPNSIWTSDDEMSGWMSDDEDSSRDYNDKATKDDDLSYYYDDDDTISSEVRDNEDRIYNLEDDMDYDEAKMDRMNSRLKKMEKKLNTLQSLVEAMETDRLRHPRN